MILFEAFNARTTTNVILRLHRPIGYIVGINHSSGIPLVHKHWHCNVCVNLGLHVYSGGCRRKCKRISILVLLSLLETVAKRAARLGPYNRDNSTRNAVIYINYAIMPTKLCNTVHQITIH